MGRNNERLQSGALVCELSVLSAAADEQAPVDEFALLGTVIVDDALVKGVCSGDPKGYAVTETMFSSGYRSSRASAPACIFASTR